MIYQAKSYMDTVVEVDIMLVGAHYLLGGRLLASFGRLGWATGHLSLQVWNRTTLHGMLLLLLLTRGGHKENTIMIGHETRHRRFALIPPLTKQILDSPVVVVAAA